MRHAINTDLYFIYLLNAPILRQKRKRTADIVLLFLDFFLMSE